MPGQENANAVKLFQDKQIIITGHDNISLGRQRSGQHHIIVGVATDWFGKGRGTTNSLAVTPSALAVLLRLRRRSFGRLMVSVSRMV